MKVDLLLMMLFLDDRLCDVIRLMNIDHCIRHNLRIIADESSSYVTIGHRKRQCRMGYVAYNSVSSGYPLNEELNPVCHLQVLLGAHHILHVFRIMVKFRLFSKSQKNVMQYE